MGSVLDKMDLTVTRRPGAWTAGVWVPGVYTTFTLEASRPQPVGPELLDMQIEGARSDARFIIYVEDDQAKLYLIERNRVGYLPDRIAYDGEDYVLTSLDDWNGRDLGYRAYVLIAYGPDEVPA